MRRRPRETIARGIDRRRCDVTAPIVMMTGIDAGNGCAHM